MAYRTLGELQAELLARLGMGAMGASGGANATLTASFLRNAQHQLYHMQDWKHMIAYEDKILGTSQNQIDYPDACARDRRVLRIERVIDDEYNRLDEGIDTFHWNTMDTESYPMRYDLLEQVLIYPKADQPYTLRFWYVADLGAFTASDDRASLDDEMIFLHALANAKAHYRQPDAAEYKGQLDTMLARIRGKSFGSNGVYRRDERPLPLAKPRVEE